MAETSRARCTAAYLAYRLSATEALRGEAEHRLPPALLGLLDQCHRSRRSGDGVPEDRLAELAEQSELHARTAVADEMLLNAWSAVDATWIRRPAHRLLAETMLVRREARDRKRGLHKVEMELLDDPQLPTSFRANPAQHFYALQLGLAQRRRQRWREACDREPGSFELAA